MPNGTINPKGRSDLDSTTRDLTPPHKEETDISLGLSKPGGVINDWTKKKRKKSKEKEIIDFANCKSQESFISVTRALRNLKKNKAAIIKMIVKTGRHNQVAAEYIYSKSEQTMNK